MTTPTVLDAQGERLEVGDRVNSRYGRAEVTEVWIGCVRIETLAFRRRVRFTPNFERGEYRCPSLTRINSEEEGRQ